MSIMGMYETKANGSYKVNNKSVNPNLYDWKIYDANLQFNSHNQLEKRFHLNDVTLLGTENSMDTMPEVINRL